MKRILFAVLAAASLPAFAADVGVSINVGQPGFYGRIDIGDVPRPVLINPQPIVIEPVGVGRAPLYLHVPPGHARHWGKHCHEYHACGEPVYFVDDRWYNEVYVPRYRERHGDRGERRDDRRDWGDHPGKGHDKGGKERGRGRDRD
jgi:hypothetical protein